MDSYALNKVVRTILLLLLAVTLPASSALWYVDSIATGSQNGTSWANAWTNVTHPTGLSAGDTVYISGGPAGTSQNYYIAGTDGRWTPAGGTLASPITYQIGQDASHNGTANFPISYEWLYLPKHVIISGDAGDGLQHFAPNAVRVAVLNGSTNVTIAYVTSVVGYNNMIKGDPCHLIHIHHCVFTFYDTSVDADHFAYLKFQYEAGFDQNTIHHNTFLLPADSTTGDGPDFLQISGNGYSVYNNLFTTYYTNVTSTQHPDGVQDNGGSSYVKIYNNIFDRVSNGPVFQNAYYAGYSSMYIYNNIAFNSGRGFDILGFKTNAVTFTDCFILNNIVVDNVLGQESFGFYSATAQADVYNNCRVQNNIAINSGSPTIDGDVIYNLNSMMTSAQAATNFVSYTAQSRTNNNMHLLANAFALIGTGSNFSTYFTTDFDTVARGSSWDIGPFEYVSPTASAITLGSGITLGAGMTIR